MKYKYKINYGGSSFVEKRSANSSDEFYPVKELNTLFKKLKESFSNYEKDVEFQSYKELQKKKDYHVVTPKQLDILIPKIVTIYNNYFDSNSTKIKNVVTEDDFKKLKENIELNKSDYVIKSTLPEDSKIIYLGDYHSSVHSLMVVIENLQNRNILNVNYELQPNYYIVFLGDIVDRGPWGIECLYIIYLLFLINNQNEIRIYILNGNHEEEQLYKQYDFDAELIYQLENNEDTINKFKMLINYLPLALFIKKEDSKWYQFCHGGIDIQQYKYEEQFKLFLNKDYSILPLTYDNESIKGFLWSDFAEHSPYISQQQNIIDRTTYGYVQVKEILDNLNIMTIISGHQDLTNYAFLLRYPLDKIYEKFGLRTFEDIPLEKNNQIDLNTIANENFANLDLGGGSNFIEKTEGNIEINQILDPNVSFNFVKKRIIDMKIILASVMSSATISKQVPYSVYGVLDLKNDESEIIYLKPDFGL